MEKGQSKSARAKSFVKRPLYLAILIALIVVILIAIIVPLAVILPKKGKKHNATVVLPLYIYPENTTSWDPLYSALNAHPNLKMTVIINPSSGPGKSTSPDKQYSEQLNKLAGYPNVKTVGYVRTGYASRNLSDVLSEVSTYSGWASQNVNFTMHGIFFDESPHQFSADAVDFMRTATKAVKDSTGLQGDKTVIRNPGVIPDARFNDTNTDISVVFEESYPHYSTKEADLAALPSHRSEYCYMVNSVPAMDKGKLRSYVDDLSKRAEFLFVTNNDKDFYESFGSDFGDFADVVPT